MMEMNERNLLLNFIDTLIHEYHLGLCFKEKKTMRYWVDDNQIEGSLKVTYASGATKAVFIFEDCDWVIKFTLPNSTNDYCTREYNNYVLAEAAGLSYYFAETVYLGTFDGIAFYAQEQVDCDESVDSTIVSNLQARYEENDEQYDVDSLWYEAEDMHPVERVSLLYGNDTLCDFIAERHINDLHCGNFGIKGDHYVMIDFSGFGRAVWE